MVKAAKIAPALRRQRRDCHCSRAAKVPGRQICAAEAFNACHAGACAVYRNVCAKPAQLRHMEKPILKNRLFKYARALRLQ